MFAVIVSSLECTHVGVRLVDVACSNHNLLWQFKQEVFWTFAHCSFHKGVAVLAVVVVVCAPVVCSCIVIRQGNLECT